jgi:hypothetical protein
MPVLVEEEEREIVGGIYYYNNETGEYLGQIGSGDELRFVSSGLFYEGRISEAPPPGESFQQVSGDVQAHFLRRLYAGGNHAVSDPTKVDSAGVDDRGNLLYNENSDIWNNYYDIMNLMYHENVHYQSGHHLLSGDALNQADLDTHIASASAPGFSNTSSQFKTETANAIVGYANKLSISYNDRYTLLSGLGLLSYLTDPL